MFALIAMPGWTRTTIATAIIGLACSLTLHAADAPVAGGLQALPVERMVPLELTNGSFEEGMAGWRENPCFSVTDEFVHDAVSALKFDPGVKFPYVPSVQQSLTGISPGLYVLKFWAKSVGMPDADRDSSAGYLRVGIAGKTQSGGRYSSNAGPVHGTKDWQELALKFHVPENIDLDSLSLSLHRYRNLSEGIAYVDDIRLFRIDPPDVEAYLRYPNYRGYLPEDGPQTVKLWTRVNMQGAEGKARVVVTALADGKEVASTDLPAGVMETVVELDAGKWATGLYSVEAKLGDYTYPPYHISKISAAQRKAMGVWFDEHQVLYIQGKPTFPIGFYNTVMEFGNVSENEITRLDKMKEAPVNFNINYTWWGCTLADRERYLGEMNKRGIWYLDTLMPFAPPKPKEIAPDRFPIVGELAPKAGVLDTQEKLDAFLTKLATEMRSYPGHSGWYVMDERFFDRVPDIFHQYTVLRKADPDHPTYGVSNKAGEMPLWRDVFDVYGMDPYPLMNMKLGNPLSLVGHETRVTVDATQGSRPVWTVTQFFQGFSKDRWPTEEEMRSMSLMAIVEGARGLFYWSFGRRALAQAPADSQEKYWRQAINVTTEIKQLEPALVVPDAPDMVTSVSDPRVRWCARIADGKTYVFAYLPAEKFAEREGAEPIEVCFVLKDGRSKSMQLRPDTADWFALEARE